MRHITVAIASVGRASVRETVRSLSDMKLPDDTRVDIVVADDDPGRAATRYLSDPGISRLPLRVVAAPGRNISSARNACLDAPTGEWVAFVDDDEWVAPDWLARLVAAQEDFEADCVFGPVYPVYPPGTPDWVERSKVHYVEWGQRGRRVTMGRTGNALMRRSIADRAGLRFDPALSRTGGEDTDFFRRYGQAGGHMVVTDDAAVYERVPPERLDIGYVRRRAIRTGQSYARARLSEIGRRDVRRAAFYADALAKAAVAYTIGGVLRPLDRGRSLAFMRKAWSNTGKLRPLVGLDVPEMYEPVRNPDTSKVPAE